MFLKVDQRAFLKNISSQNEHFLVLDSHTMGEPTRIILSGFPDIPGKSMMEKKQYMEKYLDAYRCALILEPRGHADMFGAALFEPIASEADVGVVFMDSGGYLNMCGHGSMGVATALVAQKMIEVKEPYTEVVLETPAGLIRSSVKVSDGKVQEVSIQNVPSFVYKENIQIALTGYSALSVDVVFGGSFFALVAAEDLQLELDSKNVSRFVDLGMHILRKINQKIQVKHPHLPIDRIDLVEFYGKAKKAKASLKNIVVFGDGQVDRSPCGTGSSAKVASLYHKGKLKIREEFVYESITGSLFKAEVLQETKVGTYPAVIPQITGCAYLTGIQEIILDDDDPFKYGFQLHVI